MRAAAALVVTIVGVPAVAVVACGDSGSARIEPSAVRDGSASGAFSPADDVHDGPWSDFPKDPIIDTSPGGVLPTPSNAATLFAGTAAPVGDRSGPCLVEPEIGSLVPKNWLRPRFRWKSDSDANLFEVRVHADNQTNDLVVYTTASQWVMPREIWDSLRSHSAGVPITIAIRGGEVANGVLTAISSGLAGPWGIAPAEAPGSIVYWRIGDPKAELKGFAVGDEGTRGVLSPPKIKQKSGTECVGCHTSSPDGKYAIFSSKNYGGGDHHGLGVASIEAASEGDKPDFMTAQGQAALETYVKGISTTASPFWMTGKHLVIASHEGQLRWVNLDGTDDASTKGVISLTGDAHTRPNSPNLSHDGSRLVYVSADSEADGRPHAPDNDIYVAPFNDGSGGVTKPLDGAASAEYNEYYPSFSPDDKLVTFNRVKAGELPYASPNAEVFVVPSRGGTPQRLAANDPPACAAKSNTRSGGGVENSWPKWAPAKPAPVTVDGKTYYWIVFSSTRFGGKSRQLFMAPVVVDAAGVIASYRAVYLWNQPANETNHTPAWDVFAIPPTTK